MSDVSNNEAHVSVTEQRKFRQQHKQLTSGSGIQPATTHEVGESHQRNERQMKEANPADYHESENLTRQPYHNGPFNEIDWTPIHKANTSGVRKETRGERFERKGRGFLDDVIDFRDDLYGYPVHDRGERIDRKSEGRQLVRNAGGRAHSPIGNTAFFPSWNNLTGGSVPGMSGGSARTPSKGKRGKKLREPSQSRGCRPYDPGCIPDSLIDLF